jgi:acetolactate synthase small subunit
MNTDSKSALHLISCLVEDRPGVLARISGLISARGFNIDSLAVGSTQIPEISRISLVCRGDQRVVGQIVNQLNKLVDVIRVADLSWDDCLDSELMLVKISAPAGSRCVGHRVPCVSCPGERFGQGRFHCGSRRARGRNRRVNSSAGTLWYPRSVPHRAHCSCKRRTKHWT